jgi:hypothetical protein
MSIIPNEIIKHIFDFVEGGWEIFSLCENKNIHNCLILNDLCLRYDKVGKYRNEKWVSFIDKNRYLFLEEYFNTNDNFIHKHTNPLWRYGSVRFHVSIEILPRLEINSPRYLLIQKVVNNKPHRGNIMSYYVWKNTNGNYNDSSDTDIDDPVHDRDEYNESS